MYHQGDVWLVDFDPSVGHEYQKVRPALIVESDSYLSLGNLITIVPISSQLGKSALLDVLIPKTAKNRLVSDSLIKTRQISTFDKRRFIKYIGQCQPSVLQAVLSNVSLYLALTE
ncbi:MAG: type II toxin-antitoxin system PemK/MazF family toxin [Bacteroidetes bacterium]|nr:type II toxin-antitoxin system PemK/MazF family toxin [Fibrella sp.]